jgi:hypothetical protein
MFTSVTAAAQQVPAYCTSGTGILTPAQWKHCWDIGHHLSTTTAANAGAFAGHNVAPWALLAGVIIGLLWLVSRPGSRTPATSK